MAGHYSRWLVLAASCCCCLLQITAAVSTATTTSGKDTDLAEEKASFEAAFQGGIYICTYFYICELSIISVLDFAVVVVVVVYYLKKLESTNSFYFEILDLTI